MSLDVLIVDDAGFIREILGKVVHEAGHHVIGEARTGDEAIEIARKALPDLILMDLVLPGMNGLEAIKQIKDFLPEIKIAACSSIQDEHFQKKAFDAGCFIYISKPFKKEELLQVFSMVKDTTANKATKTTMKGVAHG